jgi:hypothetical protein
MEITGATGRRLEKAFTAIESWQDRVQQDPLTAQPGSSLAADDRTLPSQPASHVAYSGLLVAVEHLHLVRSTFMATHLLYPAAYFTVLRTAMMGASQAIWVLTGQRQKRCEHALRIVIDDINQRRKLIEDLGTLTAEHQAVVDESLRKLATRLDEASAAATQIGLRLDNIKKYKLDMTTVIKEATRSAFPGTDEDSAKMRESAGFLWRSTSGHAHGTPSSRLTLIRAEDAVRRPDGSVTVQPEVSIDGITVVLFNVMLMTSEAWRLYDLRCQAATSS